VLFKSAPGLLLTLLSLPQFLMP